MSVGSCPACCGVYSCDDHDCDGVVGVVWREDGELGAMGDVGGVVWGVFWGCCSVRTDGLVCRARVQEADKVRRGKVIGIDAQCLDADGFERESCLGDKIYFDAWYTSGDGSAIPYSERCEETRRVVWVSNDHH